MRETDSHGECFMNTVHPYRPQVLPFTAVNMANKNTSRISLRIFLNIYIFTVKCSIKNTHETRLNGTHARTDTRLEEREELRMDDRASTAEERVPFWSSSGPECPGGNEMVSL